jgi:4-amino-4-deoxy-L-arabinose transferase-like glycosyltransferase
VPAIAAVVALALVLRVGAIAATSTFEPNLDPADYDRLAWSIASTGGYPPTYLGKPGTPTALRPPAYPYLLGATYEVVGRSWTAGRLLGALLGTGAVLLLMLIAQTLWDRRAAVIAGLLGAVYPPLVLVNVSLLSEALFLPVVLGFVLLVLTHRSRAGRGAIAVAVAAGALCGLAALTRSSGAVLVIPALVWVAQQPLARGRRLAMGAVVVLVAAITIAPWAIRNQRAFDAFVPISTQDGLTVAGTFNAEAGRSGPLQAVWRPAARVRRFRPLFFADLDEAELSRRLRSEAFDYARRHPSYPFVASGLNALRLFGVGPGHRHVERTWYDEMSIPRPAQPWTRWSVYAMTILAILALIVRRALRARPWPAVLWLVPLLVFLSVVFIHGGPRYRIPLDPFLVLLVTGGLVALAFERRAPGRPPGPAFRPGRHRSDVA